MRELLMKRRKAFIIYLVACFFPVISELLAVYGISLLIGSIQIGKLSYFFDMLLLSMGLTVLGIGMFIASRFLRISYMRDVLLDVRMLAFERILNLNYETFNLVSKEVYISNLINDINIFEQNFFLKLLNIIFQGGKYIVSVGILMAYDWKFGLGTIIVSLMVYGLTLRFENKTIHLQQRISDQNESLTVAFSNTFNGLEILKLNQVEDRFLEKLLKQVDRLENRKLFYSVFTEGQRGVTRFISNFVFVIMMVYLLSLALSGVSLTVIAFMLQLAGGCIWPIGFVIPMFNELKASVSIFNKIAKSAMEDSLKDSGRPYTFKHCIQLEKVHLKYADRMILENVNLRIEKGKKYLIKGASGSGKSSLMRVLSNMQLPSEGHVSLDETYYEHIDESDFNRNISYIYQEVFLFEDTIRNNITLFKEASDDEVLKAAQLAGLTELIDSREGGLNHVLTENGKNLSGGQRQRLAIARALFKKADLLFVDEGTSSLNEDLGREIEQAIVSLDATVIAISHRYYEGITELYDYIIDIKEGNVTLISCEDYFEEAVV